MKLIWIDELELLWRLNLLNVSGKPLVQVWNSNANRLGAVLRLNSNQRKLLLAKLRPLSKLLLLDEPLLLDKSLLLGKLLLDKLLLLLSKLLLPFNCEPLLPLGKLLSGKLFLLLSELLLGKILLIEPLLGKTLLLLSGQAVKKLSGIARSFDFVKEPSLLLTL